MPINYPFFNNSVNLDIDRATRLIQEASMQALVITQDLLKNNPSNARAIMLLNGALRVIQNFSSHDPIPEATKKEGYLAFVSTVSKINALNPNWAGMQDLVNTVCKSIEKIMYNRTDPRQFPKIMENIDTHIDLMANAWNTPTHTGYSLGRN